ncbi:MAG TPA: VIT1/CCC1 transporter family protein, partial [Planctomycetota bacterium]|nr:VIT1/CCC1 transporter family protein [Planctomycetota bacterium]
MACLAERSRGIRTLRAVRRAGDADTARRLIAGALPPLVAAQLEPAELDALRQRLAALPEPPERARLSRREWTGALAVFLLVFLSTFPVAVPFLVMHDVGLAKRVSNAVAIAMLFLTGVAYGRCIGRSPWLVGVAMVLLGAVLVAITMALGG